MSGEAHAWTSAPKHPLPGEGPQRDLGVCCCLVGVASFPPFYDFHPYGVYKKIEDCKPEYPAKHISPAAREFIQSFLVRDRSQRLGEP